MRARDCWGGRGGAAAAGPMSVALQCTRIGGQMFEVEERGAAPRREGVRDEGIGKESCLR